MEVNQGIEPCSLEYGTNASPQCLFTMRMDTSSTVGGGSRTRPPWGIEPRPNVSCGNRAVWRRLKDLNPHTRTTGDGFLDRCATITRSRHEAQAFRPTLAGNPGLEPGTLQL